MRVLTETNENLISLFKKSEIYPKNGVYALPVGLNPDFDEKLISLFGKK